MIYVFNSKQLNKIDDLHHKLFGETKLSTEDFFEKIQNEYVQLVDGFEKEHVESLEGPEEVIKDVKKTLKDAITFLYADILLSLKHEKIKPEFIDIDDSKMDYLEWKKTFFSGVTHSEFQELRHCDMCPEFKIDKEGALKYMEKIAFPLHIKALKGSEHEKELYKIVNDYLDNSKYIYQKNPAREEKKLSEDAFIIDNKQARFRQVIEIQRYTIMNSLVSTSLVNSAPQKRKKDIPGQYTMQWDIKENEILYYAAVDFKTDKDISVDTKLDLNDMAIINAIGSLYMTHIKNNPGEACYFIPLDIWRIMTGREANEKMDMTPRQEKDLVNRIEKLRRSFFYMDLKSQMQKYGFTFDSRFSTSNGIADDTLLNLTKMAIQTNKNGQVTDGYRINTEPILFTYSRCRKQIITFDRSLLNVTGISNKNNIGENTIAFTNYLLRRIENYRKGYLKTNIIRLETVYKDTGILSPTERIIKDNYASDKTYREAIRKERARDCKEISKILDIWVNKRFIKGYEKNGQGDKTKFVFEVKELKKLHG